MSAYFAPAEARVAELRDRGSRFIAHLLPIASEMEVRAALDDLERRFPDATHHCWAYRLGAPPRERSTDAGEPAGTAGRPMLQVLRGADLSDVLVVVLRWFGGVKLGKGGLARAYAGAVQLALEDLPRARRTARVRGRVEAPYEKIGALKRLVQPPAVTLLSEAYGERATFELSIEEERVSALREALADLGLSFAPDESGV